MHLWDFQLPEPPPMRRLAARRYTPEWWLLQIVKCQTLAGRVVDFLASTEDIQAWRQASNASARIIFPCLCDGGALRFRPL